MANTFAPFGFSQRAGAGSAPTYEQVPALIDAATAAIFQGDPVFRLSDGTIAGATTGPGPGTGVLAGVFAGADWISVSQQRRVWRNYWPSADIAASTTANCKLINDENAQFLAQVGGNATALAQSDVGLNAQFAYGTGNTANGISGAYIDMTVARATTATLPFRVIGLVTDPPGTNGTFASSNNWGVFAFNNVETRSLTAQN